MLQGVQAQWFAILGQAAAPAVAEPNAWYWLAFAAFVLLLLALDLIVFHRRSHEPTLRESALWTVFWCAIALGFNVVVWIWRGPEIGVQFLTGYLLEWSLSMDNVFVFAVIFNYFRVPLKYQYRVLFWGIIGAIVLRLTFVLAGAAMIEYAAWVLPLFGLFLVYSGIKLSLAGDSEVDVESNIFRRIAQRVFPVASGDHGSRFFVVENGRRAITPLFLVLLVVESTDVAFAVDSVPAIFGITKDEFTVFTSNIFAILGLRALYFLLAGVMELFRYLKYGLSAVLVFIGLKMVIEYSAHRFFGLDDQADIITPVVSLVIVVGLLAVSIAASLMAKEQTPPENSGEDTAGSDGPR